MSAPPLDPPPSALHDAPRVVPPVPTTVPADAGTAPRPAGQHVRLLPDATLTNAEIAPLRQQRWTAYNVAAFWMSDVHSVGGYVTAGSLFALGLASWQVLVALVVGILLVQLFVGLVATPSQRTGVPYPVVNRAVFGVLGARVPALVRGVIAMAWYGVQTFLAAQALVVVALKFVPGSAALLGPSFLGLSALGWISYGVLWTAQGALFWRGMEGIRRFIDWAGPAVYVVMIALAVLLVGRAGVDAVSLDLSAGEPLSPAASVPVMLSAVAIVVSYFSGPLLNFGDVSRYARSASAVRRGNLLGLPVNFLFFSLLTVLCASATVPVFGRLITDPIETVQAIDEPVAILLGGLTFVTATVGINIVANFISPAFDFSSVAPHRVSWRAGGMIAAVGSVALTPWNWYGDDQAILWTLGVLGALLGPLFGILVVGYWCVARRRLAVDDLYSRDPAGAYWYSRGVNPNAIGALVGAGSVSVACAVLPAATGVLPGLSSASWFVGCALGGGLFWLFERARPRVRLLDPDAPGVDDGRRARGA